MFFNKPDLTSGSRPILQPDEELLFVQNGVGLYQGKEKIAECQNGHAYLTSHRACYVDDTNPRQNSVSFDLKHVERHEYQAGFLRSSAKVTLHPKPIRPGYGSVLQHSSVPQNVRQLHSSSSSPVSRTSSPFRPSSISTAPSTVTSGTWICPICSFNNPVPSNFDPVTATETFPLPPCLTCGIPPPFSLVLKAAISASSNRPIPSRPSSNSLESNGRAVEPNQHGSDGSTITCPRCTFLNHPSLRTCEICGAPLPTSAAVLSQIQNNVADRSQSPGPEIAFSQLAEIEELKYVKFSFRTGGDKMFYDRLKGAMVQRKWLAANAPPIPRPLDMLRAGESIASENGSPPQSPRAKTGVGIAGLEQRGMQNRKNNEAVIGTAFEDLEALMASAKEIVELAQKFARELKGSDPSEASSAQRLLSESTAALGIITTKDTVNDRLNDFDISQLARFLADWIDESGMLRKQGGIRDLVDIWAEFNSARHGQDLISPSDFHKACEMFQTLGLRPRLRRFKSGLLVVQSHDWTDDKTVSQLKNWLESLKKSPPPEQPEWDWEQFGCGVTAYDATQRFGWNLGVASEELEIAEERGLLCREEGIEGLKFWLNCFLDEDD